MATNVTVVSSYVNPDYFQGKDTPFYVYGGVSVPSLSTIWTGATEYGIGTYVDPNTIRAWDNLSWDGTVLQAGDIATPSTVIFGSADYTFMLGSNEVGEYGGIELVGNQTSDARVCGVSFHNEAAAQGDKIIVDLYAERDDSDNYGALVLDVYGSGSLFNSYRAERTAHRWWAGNTEIMVLGTAELYPYADATTHLGNGLARWDDFFAMTGHFGYPLHLGSETNTVTVGSLTDTETGAVEILGNVGTDVPVGVLSFHNYLASQADKKIAEIEVSRNGDDEAGVMTLKASNISGTLQDVYKITNAAHTWYSGAVAELHLSSTALYPEASQGLDLGTLAAPFNYVWTYALNIVDTDTQIDIDSAGNMNFTDAISGTIVLADLVSVANVWTKAGTNLSPATAGDDILLTTDTEKITFSGGSQIFEKSANNMYFNSSGTNFSTTVAWNMFWKDIFAQNNTIDIGSSTTPFQAIYVSKFDTDNGGYIDGTGTDLQFTSTDAGTLTLVDLIAGGGSGLWVENSDATISPSASASADIKLEVGDRVYFDGDAKEVYMYNQTADTLRIATNDTDRVIISNVNTTFYSNIMPSDSAMNIGNSGTYWGGVYGTTFYVDGAARSIAQDSSGAMIFTDDIGGPYTLDELISGGAAGLTIAATDCPDDTTTDITIGDQISQKYFVINYRATRTMGGTVTMQSGTISVLWNNTASAIYCDSSYIGGDVGMTITADAPSNGDIDLNIIVDDTNANNLSFEGHIITKK